MHGEQNSAEGQPIQEKCPAGPDLCDDQTGHSRADHLAGEERGRVERDCIGQVLVTHQLPNKGLPHWRIQCRGAAKDKGKYIHMPKPDVT